MLLLRLLPLLAHLPAVRREKMHLEENMKLPTRSRRFDQRGFSLLQLLVVVAVVAVISGVAVLNIASARAHFRRSYSPRQFASYVERARCDPVRRHDSTTIQQIDATTYAVTMDFNSSGTAT